MDNLNISNLNNTNNVLNSNNQTNALDIQTLPDDLLRKIFLLLNFKVLSQVNLTSKKFHQIVTNEIFFKLFSQQNFPNTLKLSWAQPYLKPKEEQWKEICQILIGGKLPKEDLCQYEKHSLQTIMVEGNTLMTFGKERIIKWNIPDGKSTVIYDSQPKLDRKEMAPHKNYLIFICKETGDVRCENITNGKLVYLFGHGYYTEVTSVAVDKDSAVTTGTDKTIILWELTTGKQIRRYKGHTNHIQCVSIKEDKIISGGMNGEISVWDRNSDECLKTLNDIQIGKVLSVDCEGGLVAIGGEDKKVRIWDLNTGKIQILGENLSEIVQILIKDHWIVSVDGNYKKYNENGTKSIFDSKDVFIKKIDLNEKEPGNVKVWDLRTQSCIAEYRTDFRVEFQGEVLFTMDDGAVQCHRLYGDSKKEDVILKLIGNILS